MLNSHLTKLNQIKAMKVFFCFKIELNKIKCQRLTKTHTQKNALAGNADRKVRNGFSLALYWCPLAGIFFFIFKIV